MTYLSDQKTRMLAGQSNVKGIFTDSTKRTIVSTFKNSPSYNQVQKLTANSSSPTNLDSWIVDDSKTAELKTITLMPEQTLSSGDYIVWNNSHWINLITDFQGDIYYRGSIQKCFSSLKWKDSLGAIKEAYFTSLSSDPHGLGIQEGKVMILPSERRYITMQNNADTLNIVKNQRFIFDNGKTWRVVSSNALKTGLITLELAETEFSPELDNLQLRIANYYLHNYTIDMTNGASVNLSNTGILQLNVVTKDNGVIADLPITYSTTDSTIATVNSTGLITCVSNGSVTVKATLTNDPTIFTTMSVVVSNVVSAGWTLDITGNDYCKFGQVQKFVGKVRNNGVTDTSKLIRWTLYDDSGVLPTELGVIISQSGHEVSIRANSKHTGYVRIKGTCYEESNFTVEDLTTYSVEQLAMKTIDELFSLGLTVAQMATYTVADLANRTVGNLANETILVSAVEQVQIRSLI